MSNKQNIVKNILTQRMLPLFYADDAEVSIQVTRTLYQAGIRVLEYTNRGDHALNNFLALKKLKQTVLPGLCLGIGTVKTADEAEDFIAAGADFIVSPIVNAEVARICNEEDILYVPGCMTPTEICTAQQLGAAIIKIFPANILGPVFISSIKELFRGQLFIPTGGVELEPENINSWFGAGVCAVGLGSKLITNQILKHQLYGELHDNTVKAIALVQAANLNY
jgi:2-dehydro-3-deoxyphosphogluconate aldolase/(4S)-4-hydroxy-2-oxoglutarate aldolase